MKKTTNFLTLFLLLAVIVLAAAVGYLLWKDSQDTGTALSVSVSQSAQGELDETEEQPPAEEEITGLHCSIQLGSLEVTAGEDFGVSELNGSGYEAYIEDGIYVVNGSMTRENHIVVTVPADFLFQTVALTVNGGVLNVQNIHTQTLLTNCDKGGLHFSGSVEGDAEIQHLHGETALTLQGTQTDFNYELDYELGHIGVGKKQYARANGGESVDNQSDKTMRIHCTMGSVSVLFSDIL